MNAPAKKHSALLTDLYQLTMAFAYWKTGTHEHETVFNLFFRKNPFNGGFSVACGLREVVDYLEAFRFTGDDLSYLAGLEGNDGKQLFETGFLEYLGAMEFACDIDGIQEGTVVFPHEPLLRVRGPMIQCQILETALLNLMNFPTLIATKAARVCLATRGEPVLEFGLRRAQGTDGALAASRAAYIGGCAATSNVLAGKLFDIPVRGTHAHSWVMSFESELESFRRYADALPNNCTFLVDTYDTLRGVENAVEVAKGLAAAGHKWSGIRLDSGDLGYLSVRARQIMDEAGFPDAAIVASNDLDEYVITNLKDQGAKINVWGVGTNLVTAFDQPALGGVYKLTAIREPGREWEYKVKLSEQPSKVSTPGIHQVRRYRDGEYYLADMIYDLEKITPEGNAIHELSHAGTVHRLPEDLPHEDLLKPIYRAGRLVGQPPNIHETREHAREELRRFQPAVLKLSLPEQYPVGLESALHTFKHRLIQKLTVSTL